MEEVVVRGGAHVGDGFAAEVERGCEPYHVCNISNDLELHTVN